MKIKDFRELTVEELNDKSEELRTEQIRLKLQNATAQLDNPIRLRYIRKDIARIETVLRERKTV